MSTLRQRLTIVCLLAVSGIAPIDEALAKPRKPLTCSFIASRCRIECINAAPAVFCGTYCSDKRRECLATGNWTGIQRSFSNVVRK